MRCKRDLRNVKEFRYLRSTTRANPTPSTRLGRSSGWIDTMLRENENALSEKRWSERKASRNKEKQDRGETKIKLQGDSGTDNSDAEDSEESFEFEQRKGVFDEEDDADYVYAFSYKREFNTLPRLESSDWGPSDILDPFSFTELHTLERSPHLGRHVKTIDFHGRIEGIPTALIIERFLKVCPNVQTIILARGEVRYLPEFVHVIRHIVAHAPNLACLTIIDFGATGTLDLFKAIAKLDKLKHLSLTCTPDEASSVLEIDSTLFDPLWIPSSVTSFHLGSLTTLEFYAGLSDSSVMSITSLGVPVRQTLPDLTRFTNLQHLTITFGYLSHAVELVQTLSTSETIKSLELQFSKFIPEHAERRVADSFYALFECLPPKLESLSIPWFLRSPFDDQFKKAIKTKLPTSLRAISLLSMMGGGGHKFMWEPISEEEEAEVVVGAGKKKKPKTWLDEVGKVLGKKGVELYRIEDKYDGEYRSAMYRSIPEYLANEVAR